MKTLLVIVLASVALAGCASASTDSPSVTGVTSGGPAGCSVTVTGAGAPGSAGPSGSIRVLAAASLDPALSEVAKAFEAAHSGSHVELSFGPSSGLVAQLHQGAPADVLATADTLTMAAAVKGGDVRPPVTFACNRLAILVAKDNPKHIAELADLGRSDVRFVLCAAAVPCGRLGHQVLQRAGVSAKPVGSERDVTAVVTKVELGEVDAGIVYVTDAKAAQGRATSVAIPPAQNVVTAYPVALAAHPADPATAGAFVAYLVSDHGQAILARYGFSRS